MIHVRVTQGPNEGEEVKTPRQALSIGRAQRCDLTLTDHKVSHVHGQVFLLGPQCFYRDLLSRNGSLIRTGELRVWLGPLTPQWRLETGSEIVVGDSVVRVEAVRSDSAAMREATGAEPRVIVVDDAEQFAHSGPVAPGEIAQFNGFLERHAQDPTDPSQVRGALCRAFLEVFPNATCTALIGLLAEPDGPLQPADVDLDGVVSRRRSGAPGGDDAPWFTFAILADAYRRRGPVLHEIAPGRSPGGGDIWQGVARSCLCSPLWRAGAMSGFVHLHTVGEREQRFTRGDLRRLGLFASIASLVLNGAVDAGHHSAERVAAAAGQLVSGLAHGVRGLLASLGLNARGIQKTLPQLSQNPAWRELLTDVSFARFVVEDTLARVRGGVGQLVLRAASIKPLVRDAIESCRRYFLDKEADAAIKLVDASGPAGSAVLDEQALLLALFHCIRNSIDAFRDRARPGTVKVTTCNDPGAPERFYAVNVCDGAGGIAPEVLGSVGRRLVSTKGHRGAGLGLGAVVKLVRRMGGVVRIATSTEAAGPWRAGTVVSLCLPRPEAPAPPPGSQERALVLVPDYQEYRSRVEARST